MTNLEKYDKAFIRLFKVKKEDLPKMKDWPAHSCDFSHELAGCYFPYKGMFELP